MTQRDSIEERLADLASEVGDVHAAAAGESKARPAWQRDAMVAIVASIVSANGMLRPDQVCDEAQALVDELARRLGE